MFLIFWSFEAVYVLWQFYRNDALPRFRRKASGALPEYNIPAKPSEKPQPAAVAMTTIIVYNSTSANPE
jgi:hypothetical protein